MGVNFIPYKITGEREEDGWLKVESIQGKDREVFDSLGERGFDREAGIEYIHIDEAPEGHHSFSDSYQRPKDFDRAISQAIEYGREDIAELFEKMRKDPTLWMFISY